MRKRLKDLQQEAKTIEDVRGKGSMVAVESVEDKQTKKPPVELVRKVQVKCLERGVLVWNAGQWPNVIRFLLPLSDYREHADKGLNMFSDVVKETQRQLK